MVTTAMTEMLEFTADKNGRSRAPALRLYRRGAKRPLLRSTRRLTTSICPRTVAWRLAGFIALGSMVNNSTCNAMQISLVGRVAKKRAPDLVAGR